jgi:hypothetical protein
MSGIGNKVPGLVFKDLLTVHNSSNDNEGLEANLKRIVDGEGVESSVEISSNDLNITTHNGTNGLKLANTLLTADASDLNQLDEIQIGQSGDSNIPTNSMLGTITIDGGSY